MFGRRYLSIGFIISLLLSLFVNFTLIMRTYERLSKGSGGAAFAPQFEGEYLYFSLAWFFLFAFFLFILTFQLYKLGERLFKKNEYGIIFFVIGINAVIGFLLLQFYPMAQWVIFRDIFQIEIPPMPQHPVFPGMERIEGMGRTPDAHIPFLWPVNPLIFPRPLVTEHLFVLITVVLSVVLMQLLNSRHQMELEVEKLKMEQWKTSYNALMGQINPHFFFNSLNGLHSLVRSGEQEQTLKYLDELSNTFRYILQSNKKEMVTLGEELHFTQAYTYLLSVRYEGKLFFSIEADPTHLLCYLPILSVLPLVENAVKHNVISKQNPLYINIYTNSERQLVVSNQIQPMPESDNRSGIGLKNLWGRYQMLTGKDIIISKRKGYFNVALPLLNSPIR